MCKSQFSLYLRSKNLSDNTIRSVLGYIDRIESQIIPLTEANYIQWHVNWLQTNSPASANKYRQALFYWLDFQKIPRFEIPKLKEKPQPKKTLSVEDITEIIEDNSRYTDFLRLLALTGMRPVEAFNLTDRDLDYSQRVIYIKETKKGGARIIPIPETIKKIPLPFNFNHDSINKYLREKYQITLYVFRHSYITRLLSEGVPLFVVQQLVGHSDAKTTQGYFHSNITMLRQGTMLDPLIRNKISPQVKFSMLVEDAKKRGMFDCEHITYSIEKNRLVFEVV